MEKSANTEIQEEVIINVKSEREANSPSGNESQNGEVEHQNGTLLKDITQMLESSEPPLSLKCRIYRVPLDLRNFNKEAYTPKVISIGPFHFGDERLKAMEKHKVRYFKIFVEKAKPNVENLVSTIRDREEDVRRCYSETSNLSSDDYVKMILLDASFIIVFLLIFHGHVEWRHCDNFTTFTVRLMITIFNDLWLLENQLPFFVIEELYNLAFPSNSLNCPSLITQLTIQSCEKLVREFFSPPTQLTIQSCEKLVRELFSPPTLLTIQSCEKLAREFFSPPNEHHMSSDSNFHFLDLARTISLSQSKRRQKSRNIENLVMHAYNASQLDEAGVKLKY